MRSAKSAVRDRRQFYCLPRRALADKNLTALEHRVLGAISIHDGMSKRKGKGAGCYASYRTLTDLVGCDYTNFSKAVSRLIRLGYVCREPQIMDKRKYTLFVIFDEESDWSPHQPSSDLIVGDFTNVLKQNCQRAYNNSSKVVGDGKLETNGKLQKTGEHYIPLNGEIDSKQSTQTQQLHQCDEVEIGTVQKAEVQLKAPTRAVINQIPAASVFHNPDPSDRVRARIISIWKVSRSAAKRSAIADLCGLSIEEIDQFCMAKAQLTDEQSRALRSACLSI